jgi:NAD-dependent deacetylase
MADDWRGRPGPIAVLTGAGISTDSGIPDFRGPQGLWTRNPIAELASTYQNYVADPQLRVRAWLARRDNPAWKAEPNAGHRALVDLERSGRAVRILTQNIDRLHQRAGSGERKVLELHGNMFEVVCVSCDARGTMRETLDRVAAGEPDPACPECGGILKSATIMFGQALDEHVIGQAAAFAQVCDVFLAVGTSLRVHPAAGLCELAVRSGADLVIVNNEPTPYDELATEVIREPISKALPGIVADLIAS